MVKSKFNLIILLLILLCPNAISEIEISANDEKEILFIDSGKTVFFNATNIENTTSIEWDFGIDINGPNTRYSNLSSINYTVHAAGRYNVTFTANYNNETAEIRELIIIVNYIETFEEEIIHNEALFFAIAGSELIMSFVLGYWTQQIRKEKVYL